MQPNEITFFSTLRAHKVSFAIIVMAISAVSFTALYSVGFIPEELISADTSAPETEAIVAEVMAKPIVKRTTNTSSTSEEPTHITIKAIGVDSPIYNPQTTNSAALDEVLKKGVVHYPGSGTPGKGNMFLFAHSTTFKVVNNKAYKAFNHLDHLVEGDEIEVATKNEVYVYKVRSVKKENEGLARVDLSSDKTMLTLATCDTFSGIKQQRIVVEADLVSTRAL